MASDRDTLQLLESLANAARVLGRHRLTRSIPEIVIELAGMALPETVVSVWMPSRRSRDLRCAAASVGRSTDRRIGMSEGMVGSAYSTRGVRISGREGRVREGDCAVVVPMLYDQAQDALGVLAVDELPMDLPSEAVVAYLEGVASLAGAALVTASVVETFRSKSMTDGLTQLVTKEHFLSELDRAIAGGRDTGRPVSVFMFDVDHFKHYNDRNGHPAGDAVLSQLASLMLGHFRQGVDLCGRYGGEEFVVMFPETSGAVALGLAERFRSAVEGVPFAEGEHQPLGRVTISGGVASAAADGVSSGDLIEAADQRLYEAKHSGRNAVRGRRRSPGVGSAFPELACMRP